ncbi:HesA/MoeB/ThiF family protein [Mangrovicoccus algicola]|uniref:HesA/MoeB/ThiF family protein n=1 Tax=Mangrovicoccus algicola TaxID=2771008 RepID=A0A8J6ZB57_9RHOB|nr:HesA/MoeB/ThiF family protein [Mangrovicoccus algicola]MBE3639536.1 HesA/MoeB/ThiF family protein [Mangrovicoccus algicola]
MNRYDRQMRLPGMGQAAQARLGAARVLVVGAGGLGAALLPLLAGAGVGRIRIVDHDMVEETNLHRQTLYRMADLGRPKAEMAARALAALNPDCRAEPLVARIDPALARTEIAGADLVIDAADSFAVSYALSDLCRDAGLPLVTASVTGWRGYAGGFCGGAPSLRAVFPDLPPRAGTCAETGVMGPAVAMLGAAQAQMAIAVLSGCGPSPLGRMLTLDLEGWAVSGFRFDGAPEPEAPGPCILARADLEPGDLVVELRDAAEAPEPAVPGARRCSPAAVAGLQPQAGRRVVFACATGLRSWRAARVLQAAGHDEVAILA